MEPRLKKRLAVIGGGPIGIEAALLGAEAGFDVTVFEKERMGSHLLKWGHVRFFSAVKDNISERLWGLLPQTPQPDAYLTGCEFVEQILKPASVSPLLKGRIREGVAVSAVARRRLMKNALPGHPLRAERPFQLLIRSSLGNQEICEADVVLDAGGVYGKPNWTGESGMPCPGEAETNIHRYLPDMRGHENDEWKGKTILLVGDGHSAATAAMWLGELTMSHLSTRVHWVVKSDRSRPCHEAANDPLPEREKTVRIANDLAERPPAGWTVYRKSSVLALRTRSDKTIEATVGRGDKKETMAVDQILSLTGYRPETSISEELQVQISPVTGGAFGLAKSLMSITDCLSPVVVPPENLSSGEPGFFLIGHKSYGRLNTFLLKSGLQQLEMIFRHYLGWKPQSEILQTKLSGTL